jgi:hypothetical protein
MASYVALRVCPHASASSWWHAARRRRDVPAPIAALLKGRERVEVTPDEAAQALAWAGGLTGWTTADPKPVWLYQPAGTAASS